MNMTGAYVAVVVGFIVLAGFLAGLTWISLRYLRRARLLRTWRRPTLEGLENCAAALRGEVRVETPVQVSDLGPCLWYREEVLVTHSNNWMAESSVTRMAGFSIIIDGRFFQLPELPMHVEGTRSKTKWITTFVRKIDTTWLPWVDHLTVVGRVERRGARWLVVKDPFVGLIFTAEHPARMALKEAVKGWLGMAFVAGIAAVMVWFFVTRVRLG